MLIFYEDKERWSYTFQNIAYITRMKLIIDKMLTSKKELVISDRCMETDKNIFAKILREDGLLSDIEWKLYNMWNDIYEKYFCPQKVRNIIYLKCSPNVAYERIKKRNRGEENTIDINYLTKIHNAHEKWLLNNKKNINVLVINCNDDFVNNENELLDHVFKVKKYIQNIKNSQQTFRMIRLR